jgi:putative membrane protein insertion efficiency factor
MNRPDSGAQRAEGRRRRVSPLAWPLILLIRAYQRWISPALPPTCRFYPSCSEYAVQALEVHGLVIGSALTVWRLVRCAPWHPGGVEPVPPHLFRATEERAPC